jgi:hypothetical protein
MSVGSDDRSSIYKTYSPNSTWKGRFSLRRCSQGKELCSPLCYVLRSYPSAILRCCFVPAPRHWAGRPSNAAIWQAEHHSSFCLYACTSAAVERNSLGSRSVTRQICKLVIARASSFDKRAQGRDKLVYLVLSTLPSPVFSTSQIEPFR